MPGASGWKRQIQDSPNRIDLYAVAVRDVEASFTEMVATVGFNIFPTLVRQASEAIGG